MGQFSIAVDNSSDSRKSFYLATGTAPPLTLIRYLPKGKKMKIEFIPEGSEDCPLIRLFDFGPEEASQLVAIFSKLADGSQQRFVLTEIPGFVSVGGCCLILKAGEKNKGIIEKGKNSFECILNKSRWEHLAGLVEPFSLSSNRGIFQWLDETSSISLLISPTGHW